MKYWMKAKGWEVNRRPECDFGDKTGNDRWYEEYVPKADDLYDEHLRTLKL